MNIVTVAYNNIIFARKAQAGPEVVCSYHTNEEKMSKNLIGIRTKRRFDHLLLIFDGYHFSCLYWQHFHLSMSDPLSPVTPIFTFMSPELIANMVNKNQWFSIFSLKIAIFPFLVTLTPDPFIGGPQNPTCGNQPPSWPCTVKLSAAYIFFHSGVILVFHLTSILFVERSHWIPALCRKKGCGLYYLNQY